MKLEQVATAVVTAALIERFARDRRHNERIESRKRLKAARKDSDRLVTPDVQLGKVETDVPGINLQALLLLLCMSAALCLGLLGFHPVAMFSVLSALCILVFTIAGSRFFKNQVPVEVDAQAAEEVSVVPRVQLPSLTGTWIKDKDASSSMTAAMDLARLNRLVRSAVGLIKGMHIVHTDTEFQMAIFSFISWFKVREVYPMNGDECEQKRRDLRRGRHKGGVVITPNGRLRLQIRWPEPIAGSGYDEFWLEDQDELHVHSVMEIGGQTAQYTTVYRRKG